MLEHDVEATRLRYRERWRQFGYDPRTLGWNKDGRAVRFRAALEGLQPADYASVLDVGCGFADLLTHLRAGGWSGAYCGVDLVPELLDEAARRIGAAGDVRLVKGEFSEAAVEPADLVVAIGIFNHRLSEDSMAHVERTMRAMWGVTRRVLVCDFLSTAADAHARRDHLFYADPAAIFRFAHGLSRRVVLHHGYMPFEFQIKVWRDESFVVERPVFAPYLSP